MAMSMAAPAPEYSMKVETAEYIVQSTSAIVYSKPHSGVRVGEKPHGAIVATGLRTFGEYPNDGWVRLNDVFPQSESGEGWMLIDATRVGLGIQLERMHFERPRILKRYMTEGVVEIRDQPRGVIVGQRASDRLLRTDLELAGWVRLTEDFYRKQPSGDDGDVCEGWFSIAANPVSRWRPPVIDGAPVPESLSPRTVWAWVTARKGCVVRERPWGRVLTKREQGELLRGDLIVNGWMRLEEV